MSDRKLLTTPQARKILEFLEGSALAGASLTAASTTASTAAMHTPAASLAAVFRAACSAAFPSCGSFVSIDLPA